MEHCRRKQFTRVTQQSRNLVAWCGDARQAQNTLGKTVQKRAPKRALLHPRWFQGNQPNSFGKDGGDDETRTRDLCRDSAAWIGFTTTYNNAGTAKLPVSRTRLHELWVGLWVGKSCRWPRARRTGNPLPDGLVSSCTPPVDLLYTEPHGSV
jgi:hypothetical protein